MGRLDTLREMVGSTYDSNSYGKFIVTGFKDAKQVFIKFLKTGYTSTVSAQCIRKGAARDPYFPSVYGVGYIGQGVYPTVYYRNGVSYKTKAYTVWIGRMSACYNPKSNRSHNYTSAEICKEWHNFQNFAKWYYEQAKLYGKNGYVDKDLLFLGNTLYSESTCSYIPNSINCLFVGNTGSMINGASYCKSKNKWIAQLQEGGVNSKGKRAVTRLGQFPTKEDAVTAYSKAKSEKIKQVCLKYQEQIPPALFYKLYHGAENYLNYYMIEKGEY